MLYSTECDNVGEFATAIPNWSENEIFTVENGRRFRILKIVPFADGATYDSMWMVDEIDIAATQD
jgi:hypothetical protein